MKRDDDIFRQTKRTSLPLYTATSFFERQQSTSPDSAQRELLNRSIDYGLNTTSYGIRGKSIRHKRGFSETKEQLEVIQQTLRSPYDKISLENRSMRLDSMRNESTLSTIQCDQLGNPKNSLAGEIEELYEALSKANESINLIYTHYLSLENINDELRKEIEELTSSNSSAKDNEVKALQENLNTNVESLKTNYREKKNIENAIDKEEGIVRKLQAECDALDAKRRVLQGPHEELLTPASLNQQLGMLAQKQAAIDKKNEKYEKYIQSKTKGKN
ncbi:unnamed protein product [Blepharisma stoltei]|uniref:Uncharacterized protein n=1 Tax=Blepharisma stoltei TaxID=1481888 RepID=A0AAU9K030_9CILI|nr:unnamed protein product [Blepharisma stoltei]